MNTWLYLTAEGQDAPSSLWPCVLWSPTCQRQPMPLNQAASALQGQVVDVLLPMELCSWVRSEPWPSRRRPEAQAMAYAVEDQLSEALEVVHLSVGARDRDGCYPVMVIGRERLAAVLDLLREAGIEVRGVFVDADVLSGDQPCGAWWFGRWLLGAGLSARLAMSQDDLTLLTPSLPNDMQWLDERESPAVIDQCLTQRPTRAINLLQGAFAPQGKRLPWRAGGWALLMLALLTWGASETRIRFLDSEANRLAIQNERRFKALYPEQSRIVDMAAQLKALQSQPVESQNTRIAGLVRLIEQVIGASPVEVQRIEFRAGEGWKIQLTASGFTELEQLRERGRQQGTPVRLDSANKAADRVQATLTVEDEA
ncbi:MULTISPECIES: type II secretion system protein GspL [unclassified Pseudomonas]|uniref:type II secretion system protein GspL n=1 Tax=unclassified Pseudomonas TaxID=196821 RepID=UPI000C88392F|nr:MULTISPECIES: type II secretion system protein GspL [unclassified Pseudomonas]PMZ88881.1 type II secretory protein pull [Pseudomonas sp. FW215-T2]PNA10813.1 type II secretory protein pull [Pseudomonas sp. FW215-R3]PNB39061.1 type II secretory protein pull [Pseudomonas sp. FW305-131]